MKKILLNDKARKIWNLEITEMWLMDVIMVNALFGECDVKLTQTPDFIIVTVEEI